MNWLAHIYLADDTEEDILGNFLGDFLLNVQWRTFFSAAVQDGIKTHFAVDKFSTMHPVFCKSCLRISPRYAIYSAILIDMFYDHFLARNWSACSQTRLVDYTAYFYMILQKHREILPDKLLDIVPQLIKENWLVSYREISGIKQALRRLALRMPHDGRLEQSIDELEKNYAGLENDFFIILKELKEFTETFRKNRLQHQGVGKLPA